MTSLDIELEKAEPEIITVERVVRKYKEGKAGFPGIEFIDTEGRRQNISFLQCVCTLSNFNKIGPGSQLKITKIVRVSDIILLPPKKK